MTRLSDIRLGWNEAARVDAMFNILTDPSKVGGGWTADEFFAHGQREIDEAMVRTGPLLKRRRRALDFGCGVGRLTQALAAYFDRVDGCDLSPEMVDRARGLNRLGGRVAYHRNGAKLPFDADSFDFVYSMIVLQHMPQRLQRGYVREFLRVLKSDGVAVFQIPEGPDYQHLSPWLSMFGTGRGQVERWVAAAGGRVVDVETLGSDMWESHRFTAVPDGGGENG